MHAEGKKLADDIDFNLIARRSLGMSGADLANLMNEAAIMCARYGKNAIDMEDVNEAIEKIQIGLKKKNTKYSE